MHFVIEKVTPLRVHLCVASDTSIGNATSDVVELLREMFHRILIANGNGM